MLVPVVLINNERWADLKAIGQTHLVCGEKVECINSSFSAAGGHRVRVYRFKKNVHWKVEGLELDVSDVPRRRQV